MRFSVDEHRVHLRYRFRAFDIEFITDRHPLSRRKKNPRHFGFDDTIRIRVRPKLVLHSHYSRLMPLDSAAVSPARFTP